MLQMNPPLETTVNDTEISRKSFQKSRKLLSFGKRTIQLKILKIPGARFNGKNFKNFGIPREVVLVFGNFGKCCSVRYWKLPKIQTAPKIQYW